MKHVKFHPDAESEMIEAAAYYETQQPDLGRRFLASVQDAVNRIVLNPRLYPTCLHPWGAAQSDLRRSVLMTRNGH